ncbi:Protein H24K24.3 a [Aphelenchoides avenae]|nr:Protein H24K24.3 a [Aphelenchus avenae]
MHNGTAHFDTAGKAIRCRAAIAWAPKEPLTIEEIEVAPPKAGEVRIKVCYTALCHSDTIDWSGRPTEGVVQVQYPAILGHEAAGIVESVGEGVTHLHPGDHVLPCFTPHCGQCKHCKSAKSNMCLQMFAHPNGFMLDGTSRFSHEGRTIHHFLGGMSTFSEYTVCVATSCTKIDDSLPLNTVCLLSCGAGTGYGAAVKVCHVEKGSRCAVWGIGGVGLSVIMGCRAAGASQVVAIDLVPSKYSIAKKMGATHYVNPAEIPEGQTLPQYLQENFDGGFDYTFECIGRDQTMVIVHVTKWEHNRLQMDALASAQMGSGTCCLIGVPLKGAQLNFNPMEFIVGKRLTGCVYGGLKCREDLPKLCYYYKAGKMPLENLISHRLKLDDINQAFDLLHSGEGLRTVMEVSADY